MFIYIIIIYLCIFFYLYNLKKTQEKKTLQIVYKSLNLIFESLQKFKQTDIHYRIFFK